MASQFGPRTSAIRERMRDDFVDGLKCFKSDDYEGALMFFRAADECAAMDDIYQGRYTSFPIPIKSKTTVRRLPV